MQRQKYFFGENDNWKRDVPTHEEKMRTISRDNVASPFHRFIGNDKAIKKLQVVAYDALGKDNHLCREMAFSIFGPPSSGKTTLVKIFSKTLDIPFMEFGPQIKQTEDILKEAERILSIENVPLVEFKRRNYFELPPCVIFIDEIHAVSDNIIQALLKATEYSDGMMITEKGRTVNCFNVCWMIATTDEGMLFDAFRSRFSPLVLTYLSNKEIGKIVNLAHPDIPLQDCEIIAYYNSRVPRKALEFARYTKMVRSTLGDMDWKTVIKKVAQDEDIDDYGMQAVHRKVIQALAKSPIAMSRMSLVIGRKKEEVERFVMPWLMVDTEDGKALVKVTNKGYDLTDEGRVACQVRGFLADK